MGQRPYVRHLWPHQHALHRALVRKANHLLAALPDAPKYGIGRWLRDGRAPYCFVRPGDVVLQVGAPLDTLLAGRSRAAYFALLVGAAGRVLVVEPDANSVERFRRWAQSRGLSQAVVEQAGAWSAPGELEIFVDDAHPATSFTAGTNDYDAERLADYRRVMVRATTIDEVVATWDPARVDLISITTNGAEIEILHGASQTIERFRPMFSLARTSDENIEKMARLGYLLVTADDRGYTFVWDHGGTA